MGALRMTDRTALLAVVLQGILTLAAAAQEPPTGQGFIRTRGKWLVDEQGRVLILRGMNVSNRSKRPPFLAPESKEEVFDLRKAGFNSVRYLIVWEAVEPEPGKYDEAYLDQVAERLGWFREAGIRVVLDMHQDLYSRKYAGDGAPDWACLDEGIPFARVDGAWYLNYSSPSVVKAFDNFWANGTGPGGVGVQDRFIAAWRHVARRFREDTNIVGFDLFNEPYYGSYLYSMFLSVAIALGRELDAQTQFKFLKFMTDPTGSVEFASWAVQELEKKNALWKILDNAGGPAQEFERTILQAFHNRLVAAIRQVDRDHICFFEAAGGPMSSTRFRTGLDAPKDAQGAAFGNAAFAPHHYEFSVDLRFPYRGTPDSIQKELERATTAGDRMAVPTWFGEWGAIATDSPETNKLVRDHLDAFDRLLCGWVWWSYTKHLTELSFWPMLGRPYAWAIAGTPTRMHCTDARFELEFNPLPKGGETIIWVSPDLDAKTEVRLGEGGSARSRRDREGLVYVICPPGAKACTVVIELAPKRP